MITPRQCRRKKFLTEIFNFDPKKIDTILNRKTHISKFSGPHQSIVDGNFRCGVEERVSMRNRNRMDLWKVSRVLADYGTGYNLVTLLACYLPKKYAT